MYQQLLSISSKSLLNSIFRFSKRNHLYPPNLWKCSYTCSMSACGEWTKIEGLSLGDDSRQSCASVALGLYIKAIALESLPSYSNNLWCSSRKRSLSALNLNVPWNEKQGWRREKEKKIRSYTLKIQFWMQLLTENIVS